MANLIRTLNWFWNWQHNFATDLNGCFSATKVAYGTNMNVTVHWRCFLVINTGNWTHFCSTAHVLFLFAIGQTFFFCLKCHLFIVPIIKVVATFKAHEALRLSLKNNYTHKVYVWIFLHRFCFEKRAYFQILMSFLIKMDSARKFQLPIQLDLLILIFLLFRFADFCHVETTSNFFP